MSVLLVREIRLACWSRMILVLISGSTTTKASGKASRTGHVGATVIETSSSSKHPWTTSKGDAPATNLDIGVHRGSGKIWVNGMYIIFSGKFSGGSCPMLKSAGTCAACSADDLRLKRPKYALESSVITLFILGFTHV